MQEFTVPLPLAAKEITERLGERFTWSQAWQAVLCGVIAAEKVRGRWMCSQRSIDAYVARGSMTTTRPRDTSRELVTA